MAKGRRLTTSRSELYLGSNYQFSHQQQTVNNGSSSSELAEDEVWSTINGDAVNGDDDTAQRYFSQQHGGEWTPHASYGITSFADPHATPRRPPRRSDSSASSRHHRQVGGLSLAFVDGTSDDGTVSPGIVHQFRQQDTARTTDNSPRGRHMATSAPVNVPDWSKIYRVDSVESLHDEVDGFDESTHREAEIVPPHEYLARSRRAAANSVFEGVGRTLKGRDLRRVRDAVWSQTGFYG